MKNLSIYILGVFFLLFSGCEELQKEPPEKFKRDNPNDSEYSKSPPSPEVIREMDGAGPALILYTPDDLELKSDYIFPLYLLAKDMEDIIGINARIQFSPGVKIDTVLKYADNFSEGADGMAFYSTLKSVANDENELTISTTRLGGSPEQGYTGDCAIAQINAKATSGITFNREVIFSFKEDGSCQLRDIKNDTVTVKNLKNETIKID